MSKRARLMQCVASSRLDAACSPAVAVSTPAGARDARGAAAAAAAPSSAEAGLRQAAPTPPTASVPLALSPIANSQLVEEELSPRKGEAGEAPQTFSIFQ